MVYNIDTNHTGIWYATVVTCYLSFFGTLFVLFMYWRAKELRSFSTKLVVLLCLSDLLIVVNTMYSLIVGPSLDYKSNN